MRRDIEKITQDLNIASTDFNSLGIYEDWHKIEEKIYNTFCQIDHPKSRPIWLWEYFKLDTYSLSIKNPYQMLEQLVNPNEEIWFFLNGDRDKFWFYQGKITAITKVISESSYIDEIYLVSKKYDWLICINHHDTLIATGKSMATRLKNIAAARS